MNLEPVQLSWPAAVTIARSIFKRIIGGVYLGWKPDGLGHCIGHRGEPPFIGGWTAYYLREKPHPSSPLIPLTNFTIVSFSLQEPAKSIF